MSSLRDEIIAIRNLKKSEITSLATQIYNNNLTTITNRLRDDATKLLEISTIEIQLTEEKLNCLGSSQAVFSFFNEELVRISKLENVFTVVNSILRNGKLYLNCKV